MVPRDVAMPHDLDPTLRFSDRVENYVRYRPGYPPEVLDALVRETGLAPGTVVADVGSGTGISAALFLRHGCTVFAVEPNGGMRQAAERLLEAHSTFHSIAGTAEATGLADRSVDLVAAAQAFHWFRPDLALREFRRILRPAGWIVLLWNTRRTDGSPFLREYEALLQRFGTDYRQVDHRNVDQARLREFLGTGFRSLIYANRQELDLEGVRGRLLSSSYAPAAGHPDHDPMLRELDRIFAAHERDGRVSFEYDTEMHFAPARPEGDR